MQDIPLLLHASVGNWIGYPNNFWPFTDKDTVTCTFINHYSLLIGINSGIPYSDFNYVFADGGALAKQVSIGLGVVIPRVSFDLSSIAKTWIYEAATRDYHLHFIGGSAQDAVKFTDWLRNYINDWPDTLYTVNDGYRDISPIELSDSLNPQHRHFIVFGMGTPLQEKLALETAKILRHKGLTTIVITCGGFITQTALYNGQFYPKTINKLGLRWLWRCYKQPYVIIRLIRFYPRSYLYVRNILKGLLYIKKTS